MIWAHFIPRLRVHNAEPLLHQVLWQLRNVQLIFLIFTCCPTFFATFSLNNVQMHWPRWRNEYTMSIAYRGAKTIQILSLIAIILSIAPFPLLSLPLAIWPSLSANKQGRQVNALISIAMGTAQTQSKLLLALRENMPVSKKMHFSNCNETNAHWRFLHKERLRSAICSWQEASIGNANHCSLGIEKGIKNGPPKKFR